MTYDAPGKADKLDAALSTEWNKLIQAEHARMAPEWGSRFFSLDPGTLKDATPAAVTWFGDPAEPAFCLSPEDARVLSDWGARGRQVLHNEYCEYVVVEQMDAHGKFRPKRVEITTELREYWLCVATHAPAQLRKMATEVLGAEPSWMDLYGAADPKTLTAEQRAAGFTRLVAGSEHTPPQGRLNTEHALFMSHPINGLDDLIYIVMFGARPYARKQGGKLVSVAKEDLFRHFGVEHLACRHADPAAAMGAQSAAFAGRAVAFANPLGMYISAFSAAAFSVGGQPVPQEWVRWGRGQQGMHQRLVFRSGRRRSSLPRRRHRQRGRRGPAGDRRLPGAAAAGDRSARAGQRPQAPWRRPSTW
jgi:hypothetical protein